MEVGVADTEVGGVVIEAAVVVRTLREEYSESVTGFMREGGDVP